MPRRVEDDGACLLVRPRLRPAARRPPAPRRPQTHRESGRLRYVPVGTSAAVLATMTTAETSTATVHVGSFAELASGPPRVISAGGRSIVLLLADGRIHALDNRCPHMGFPLSRGTVRDGILTCHWHHARFALAGGSTFDPFADDVASFVVEVRDGEVWLDPTPRESDRRAHCLRQLGEGLEQNLPLALAKAVIGLDELDATSCVYEQAALFATRNRAAGWSSGLSILTAMANVQPLLRLADRPRALFQGLVHVARSTASQPPHFALRPLETSEQRPGVYRDWFRRPIPRSNSRSHCKSPRKKIESVVPCWQEPPPRCSPLRPGMAGITGRWVAFWSRPMTPM